MSLFRSRINNKFLSFVLLIFLSFFIVGCTDNLDGYIDGDIIDDTNEPEDNSFQNMFETALNKLQTDDNYNLVIEINRKRANSNQLEYRRDDYTFFNQNDIFAYFEDGGTFFKRIENRVYAYYESNEGFVQTLAYPAYNDWNYAGFLPDFSLEQPTMVEKGDFYEFSFSVNSANFLEDYPAFLSYLLTISNATLKEEGSYDLTDIDFNITLSINKSSRELFNISFDTVDYLNEILNTQINEYREYTEADVHFLYNTTSYTHDLNSISTYTVDDYPNYAWADVDRNFIELNTPKDVNFQYSSDADLLSFNVMSDRNYHIEISDEAFHSVLIYDSDYTFIGFYNMNLGSLDIDLSIGNYYLVFNSSGAIGNYAITITTNN